MSDIGGPDRITPVTHGIEKVNPPNARDGTKNQANFLQVLKKKNEEKGELKVKTGKEGSETEEVKIKEEKQRERRQNEKKKKKKDDEDDNGPGKYIDIKI